MIELCSWAYPDRQSLLHQRCSASLVNFRHMEGTQGMGMVQMEGQQEGLEKECKLHWTRWPRLTWTWGRAVSWMRAVLLV